MKRILFSIICISLVSTCLAQMYISDKNPRLFQAAADGNLPAVQNLLAEGAYVNARNDANDTPLHSAVSGGHIEIVSFLISHGANINATNYMGVSPAMLAVINNFNDIADMLFAYGAEKTINIQAAQGDVAGVKAWLKKDPNLVNAIDPNDGHSPMHWAAYMDHLEIIKLLIENDANVNIRGGKISGEITPLYWAVRKGNINSVKLLIANGADVKIKSKGVNFFLYNPGSLEIARLLIKNGADVKAKDDFGGTPLHSLATEQSLAIIQSVLFEKTGGTNLTWETDFPEFRDPAEKIIAEIADLYITKGVDINAKVNSNGATALWIAVQSRQTKLIKLLIAKGADLNMKLTTNGETALRAAKGKGYTDIVQLLEKAGAKE